MIFNEVPQMGVFFFANRRFQGNRILGDFFDFPDFPYSNAHSPGQFFIGGFPAFFLEELAGNPVQLVNGFHHMHRNTDSPCLVRNGPCNGLADPPGGIGGEFIALRIVEFIHCL